MNTILNCEQHLFGSVREGLDRSHGPGFQTIAATPGVAAGPDLTVLVEVAFYALPRDLAVDPAPAREYALPLPSGRWAVGRSWPCGVDFLGRAGNYRAHHLVLDLPSLLAVGSPFELLAAYPPLDHPLGLDSVDLQPLRCRLPGVPREPDLTALRRDWWPRLIEVALDSAARPLLLIGPDDLLRPALSLIWEVAARFAEPVAFCTHAYNSAHLAHHFGIWAANQRTWAPRLSGLQEIDLLRPGDDTGTASPLARWIEATLSAAGWPALRAGAASLAAARRGAWVPQQVESPALLDLLEAAAPGALAAGLARQPDLIPAYLAARPQPGRLASSLLAAQPAPRLLADLPASSADAVATALAATARPRDWRRWVRASASEACWQQTPALRELAGSCEPWWRRWRRRNEPLPAPDDSSGPVV
ncbi:MAG: hypothetical protein IT204_12245 [Fimbriimonadaceae bacterium]|nr:hypothetical protein [Fimbriimonadaceae bacterium]